VAWGRQAVRGQGQSCTVHAGRSLLSRSFSCIPTIVDTRLSTQDGFHGHCRSKQAQRPMPRPAAAAAAGPSGVPTAAGADGGGARAGPASPGPQGPRAPLNRADNDPRFPRQAFCCLVSLGFVWSKPFPACPILSPG
jgi:hypothetical protein